MYHFLFNLFSPLIAYAQTGPESVPNPINSDTFKDVLFGIADFVFYVGTPVLILAIILVGLKFVMAQGNAKKLEEAKSLAYAVLIGTAIIVGSSYIASMVIDFAKKL